MIDMTAKRKEIVQKFQLHEGDTGSPEVQVALLTERIVALTDHAKANPKDHASRRGMLQMVSRRRSLLDYLVSQDKERYQKLIAALNLRK